MHWNHQCASIIKIMQPSFSCFLRTNLLLWLALHEKIISDWPMHAWMEWPSSVSRLNIVYAFSGPINDFCDQGLLPSCMYVPIELTRLPKQSSCAQFQLSLQSGWFHPDLCYIDFHSQKVTPCCAGPTIIHKWMHVIIALGWIFSWNYGYDHSYIPRLPWANIYTSGSFIDMHGKHTHYHFAHFVAPHLSFSECNVLILLWKNFSSCMTVISQYISHNIGQHQFL